MPKSPVASAYIVNRGSRSIAQYRVRSGGGLQPLPAPPAPTGPDSGGLAAAPSGRFVYAIVNPDDRNSVAQYRVGPGGALQPLAPLNVVHSPPGQDVLEIEVNWPRHALYVVTNDGEDTAGHILQYRIGPEGRPRPLRPPSVEVIVGPSSLEVTPDGSSAYAIAGDFLAPYHVRGDGALVPFSLPARGLDRTPVQGMAHTPVSILVLRPPR